MQSVNRDVRMSQVSTHPTLALHVVNKLFLHPKFPSILEATNVFIKESSPLQSLHFRCRSCCYWLSRLGQTEQGLVEVCCLVLQF
eukprot:m.117315 g.117315  ORF g.117315 m.117315 type:complete len:85 (+) comp13626_c0_seq3:1665-1919(+)